MARQVATALILLLTAAMLAAAPANAVIMGSSSSLGSYTVRLVGNGYCSGVVIARQLVATAAHCAQGMRVLTDGGSVRVVGISRSALLDDGRRVSVSGDGAFLRLASPLPSGLGPPPVGPGSGDIFTIAGYGTMTENETAAFGSLHEATLVPASARALIDPHRSGGVGASACFGDSGGPVMRGGVLVGVITRAAYPSARIACGDLTRWTPITVSGSAKAVAADADTAAPRGRKARRDARQSETASAGLFGQWFSEKVETRRTARRSVRRESAER